MADEPDSAVQSAFEYSDGTGNVLVKKVQAEPEQPGGPLRWVASGKTILNNKGKPVKQYEPYFSPHRGGASLRGACRSGRDAGDVLRCRRAADSHRIARMAPTAVLSSRPGM